MPQAKATPAKRKINRPSNVAGHDLLAELDRWAKTAEKGWHPWFVLMRYPRLRQDIDPITFRSITPWDSFRKIRTALKKDGHCNGRPLQGLTLTQRNQLTALIYDIHAEFDACDYRKKVSPLAKEKDSRCRNLRRRIKNVQKQLTDLHIFAQSLHRWIGGDVAAKALRCRMILDECRIPASPQSIDVLSKGFDPGSCSSVAEFGMVRLFWFFFHACRIPKREAEVRVALIRNALWAPWISPVTLVPHHDAVKTESMGCSAVRLAVARH